MSLDDHPTRLTRLETKFEHMDKTLTQLVKVSTEMSHAITRLTQQQQEQERHAKEIQELHRHREKHENRIAIAEQTLETVKNLPVTVERNTQVSKVATWVASLILAGAIGTFWFVIQTIIASGVPGP
jgi:chromosome segregation ATPase